MSEATIKQFPVQTKQGYVREPGKIRESVYMAAYEVYSHVHGPQEAMLVKGCRGGFAQSELIAFLYARSFPKTEWRNRVDEAFAGMEHL